MAFVTFVIAMAAIGAFYLYSTKPACRQAVNNWSILACDALQGKVTPSSRQIVKRKEVPAEALPSGSVGSSGSTGSQLTGTSDDDKAAIPEGETRTGATVIRSSTLNQEEGRTTPVSRTATVPTESTPEKGLVTGEKKKKKKKSKSKKSKKKKTSKGSKKEVKKSEEILPEDP
uniref:Bm9383 n=1 Tax=Brugia malayi TaxID=6279 RepID=A0A0I9N4N5_BRUMA|nr:Bm9383 [Brugia malayi]